RALLLALALSAAAASASASVTAGFEGITTTFTLPTSVVSQGYNFAATGNNLGVIAGGAQCVPVCADDGTATLIFGTPTGGINPPSIGPLVITGPTPFTLSAFDYAELQPGSVAGNVNATFLRVTGFLTIGGSLTRLVDLDGINDGPGGVADFQTATFD